MQSLRVAPKLVEVRGLGAVGLVPPLGFVLLCEVSEGISVVILPQHYFFYLVKHFSFIHSPGVHSRSESETNNIYPDVY